MGISITFKGLTLTASTVEEAAALAIRLTGGDEVPKVSTAASAIAAAPYTQALGRAAVNGRAANVVKFLQTIVGAGANGAGAADFQSALGIENPKGIGSHAGLVNDAIRRHGLKVDDVYTKSRTAKEGRFWLSGPRIAEAIELVKLESSGGGRAP